MISIALIVMTVCSVAGAAILAAMGKFYKKGPFVIYNEIDEPEPMEPPKPVPETIPEPVVKQSLIITFCTALRDFEGVPGDANYRNNNPGNCRCSPVGYAPMYGSVRCSPSGFAIFPTYELGWKYLRNLVLERVKKHPTWTFTDFFLNYAPPSDNNPSKEYARFVATRCAQPVDTVLSNILF